MREDVGYTHPLRAAPAFGSPERGAVAALRAVTEGLRAAWVRCGYAVGAGFHALPAWNEGLPWCARTKWCAGCASVILCAGWRKRGRRTVGDAGAVGQAKPLRLTQPRHSSEHGASRTPPLTGDSGTQVSASRQRVAQTSQTSAHALGSPERGAVTARSGVTEGLVQRGCDAISLPVIRRKGRRGRRPLRWVRDIRCGMWGNGCGSRRLPMVRGLCPRNINRWSVNARLMHRGKHGQNRAGPTVASNLPRRSRDRGAPRTVHPTAVARLTLLRVG